MAESSYETVIIGNSVAGVTAALELRRLVPTRRVTLVTAEPAADYYSKPLLTYYLAGKISREQLFLKNAADFARAGVEVIPGFRVHSIEFKRRCLVDAQGREIKYNQLLIASGADPIQISLPGSDYSGITSLRNLQHLQIIASRLQRGQDCVIIGGGLVGLKTAWALRERKKNIKILISSSYPFSQGLDAQAGYLLAEHFQASGIELICNDNASAFVGTAEQGVTGVRTEQGRYLPADLVVVGKGVRPNSFWPGQQQGIPVNCYQETEYSNIYAAGDVTLIHDRLTGSWRNLALWPVAARQGLLAARNMAGYQQGWEDYYPGNSAHFDQLRLITGGVTNQQGVEAEIISCGRGNYIRLNFIDKILVGFILLGKAARGAGPLTWGLYKWKKDRVLDWFSRKNGFSVEIQTKICWS